MNLEVIRIPSNSTWNHSRIWVEFPWNFPGIPTGIHRNSIQISLGVHRNHSGISLKFQWNSTGNPWKSTGIVHSYHSCGFPMEFWHSVGFQQNLPELMEEGNSHLKILVAWDIVIIDLLNYNLWHIVWYCVSHSHIVKVGRPKNMAIFLLVSAVTVWNKELYRCRSECNFDDLN